VQQAKLVVATKSKKRSREDDIPPVTKGKVDTQLRAYKQLEVTVRCEMHHGHCFVDRSNGADNHCRLDHAEMTLWAKKTVCLPSFYDHELVS
jgi:hypothetical protein